MKDTLAHAAVNIATGTTGAVAAYSVPSNNQLMPIIIGLVTITIQIINFIKQFKK